MEKRLVGAPITSNWSAICKSESTQSYDYLPQCLLAGLLLSLIIDICQSLCLCAFFSKSVFNIKLIGVLRDTARAPQPPTDPPTGHRISLHGLAQIDQNCQFWAKFGRLGQKILISTGKIKSFVTHITENPPRHLVHIVFWSGIGHNVQKMAIFCPK